MGLDTGRPTGRGLWGPYAQGEAPHGAGSDQGFRMRVAILSPSAVCSAICSTVRFAVCCDVFPGAYSVSMNAAMRVSIWPESPLE